MNPDISFWEYDAFFSGIDVAIIGGGIVGLNAAIQLKARHKKLKIVVFEKGVASMGASSKNAGFACFGSPGELLDDLEKHSEDQVFSLVERRWRGLARLRKNLGDKAIDFKNWGGYEVFSNPLEYERCAAKLDYLNQMTAAITGQAMVYKTASPEIKRFGLGGVHGMLMNTCEGQIDTGKMITALLAKAHQTGILVLHGIEITKMEEDWQKVLLQTGSGMAFGCRKVLVCVNGFASKLLPGIEVAPARAQVAITRPIPKLKLKGAFHFDKGYYYFRNIGDRILIGGGRNLDFKTENTDKYGLTDLIQNGIEYLLQNMAAPYAKPEIEMRWSGIMGLGPEKKPIIKPVSQNIYCAVRMGGMGVAIGNLVGEDAADMVGKDL